MHRTVICWVIYGGRLCRRAKIFYLSQPGIEPRTLDLQANTLPRRCKSRLLPQGSRSVLYTYTYYTVSNNFVTVRDIGYSEKNIGIFASS